MYHTCVSSKLCEFFWSVWPGNRVTLHDSDIESGTPCPERLHGLNVGSDSYLNLLLVVDIIRRDKFYDFGEMPCKSVSHGISWQSQAVLKKEPLKMEHLLCGCIAGFTNTLASKWGGEPFVWLKVSCPFKRPQKSKNENMSGWLISVTGASCSSVKKMRQWHFFCWYVCQQIFTYCLMYNFQASKISKYHY